jgi:hypothetical protein
MTKGRRRRARRRRRTLVALAVAVLAGQIDPSELFAAAPDAGAGAGAGETAPHADCASADDCARMHGVAPAQTAWGCEAATCVLRDAPEAPPAQPPAPPAQAPPPGKSRHPKRDPRPSRRT